MAVTARIRCNMIQDFKNPDGEITFRQVYLVPVYSADPDSPNYSFSTATPSGQFMLGISNPAAFEQFELNKEYDVSFTPTEV